MPSVRTLMGLKVAFKVPFMLGVLRLSKNIKVSENVLEVKAEWLMELAAAFSCSLSAERASPHLIILLPPFGIGQRFICCGTK